MAEFPSQSSDSLLIRLTGLADPDLLQVGLLDVGEMLQAGDVEAISDAEVELLQLDVGQELVEPLSVLVHHHDPAHLSLCSTNHKRRVREPGSVSVCFTRSLTHLGLVWLPRRPDKSPQSIMLGGGLVPNRCVWDLRPLCSNTFKNTINDDKHSYRSAWNQLHTAGAIKESLRFLPPPTSDSAPNVATRAPNQLLISRASAAMSQVTFRCQLPWRKEKHPSVINNQLGYIAASARSFLTTSVGWYQPGLAFICGRNSK